VKILLDNIEPGKLMYWFWLFSAKSILIYHYRQDR